MRMRTHAQMHRSSCRQLPIFFNTAIVLQDYMLVKYFLAPHLHIMAVTQPSQPM